MGADHPVTVGGGRYRILARMGLGGQAAVYRAYDERLRVERALKVLLPEFANRRDYRARFESEAQALALLDHPYVVRVLDVVPHGPLPFIVMELLPGGTLATWLKRHGPMPPRMAIRCMLQVAAALKASHAEGIVHRDVKPHNILIDGHGRCKLGDFGIARADGGPRAKVGSALGTEGYMAPEQAIDANLVDGRADVYGLGMTLWVCLTATSPVALSHDEGLSHVHPVLRGPIVGATAIDPGQRPPSVADFARQIKHAAAGLPTDPGSPALPHEIDEVGQVDGFSEIASLVDPPQSQVPSDSGSPAPAARPVPTYVMSSPAASRASTTPPWVERVQAPAAHTFTLGASTPGIAPRGPAAPPLWRKVARVLAHVGIPGFLLLFLIVVLVSFGHLQVRSAIGDVEQARFDLEEVLLQERGVLADMENLGGNPIHLESRWVDWQRTTDPVRRRVQCNSLVSEIALVAEELQAPGSTTWARAEVRVNRIVGARDAVLQAEADYLAVRRSVLGRFAVLAPRIEVSAPAGS